MPLQDGWMQNCKCKFQGGGISSNQPFKPCCELCAVEKTALPTLLPSRCKFLLGIWISEASWEFHCWCNAMNSLLVSQTLLSWIVISLGSDRAQVKMYLPVQFLGFLHLTLQAAKPNGKARNCLLPIPIFSLPPGANLSVTASVTLQENSRSHGRQMHEQLAFACYEMCDSSQRKSQQKDTMWALQDGVPHWLYVLQPRNTESLSCTCLMGCHWFTQVQTDSVPCISSSRIFFTDFFFS